MNAVNLEESCVCKRECAPSLPQRIRGQYTNLAVNNPGTVYLFLNDELFKEGYVERF
jgi:hypothetical protein